MDVVSTANPALAPYIDRAVRTKARRMLAERARSLGGVLSSRAVSETAQACFDASLGKLSPRDVLIMVDEEARKLGL